MQNAKFKVKNKKLLAKINKKPPRLPEKVKKNELARAKWLISFPSLR